MTTLRLATRRSKLALAQARAYALTLKAAHPDLSIEEVLIVTSGDKFQDQPLQDLGGKGLFIKEVEEALLDGRADFAVHSMKDVPAELEKDLEIACIPPRDDPRDVLICRGGETLEHLAPRARVGTSSLRRKTMLLAIRPDLTILPFRGNVDTRLRKLEEGQVDAIVLANAGLRRLRLEHRGTELLEPEKMLPAVGQGALGIECRVNDEATKAMVHVTNDAETELRVSAERAFMAAVEGNCRLPVAAFAIKSGQTLWLRAMLADDDGSNACHGERRAPWTDVKAAHALGTELGLALRQTLRQTQQRRVEACPQDIDP